MINIFFFIIVFFLSLKIGNASTINDFFESAQKFSPYIQSGFAEIHQKGIKGSREIAIIDNSFWTSHPALEHVQVINCTNIDDESLETFFQSELIQGKRPNLHSMMVAGIIAARPRNDQGECIVDIDYNTGLAYEAKTTVYLTKICQNKDFQDLSNNTLGKKIRNTECENLVRAFNLISNSSAQIICISNALPYDVEYELDFRFKRDRGLSYIRRDVLEALKNCLYQNGDERLLVISASNTGQLIGEYNESWNSIWGTKHLEELTLDPEVSKRLIIVGNSSPGLTGNLHWDYGHPDYVKQDIAYHEKLLEYITPDKKDVAFSDYIVDFPFFVKRFPQHIIELTDHEIENVDPILQQNFQFSPYLRQKIWSNIKNQIENRYPLNLTTEKIIKQINILKTKHLVESEKLYPFSKNTEITLYPTSGKAGCAKHVFISTIGTTILAPTLPEIGLEFPGGSLNIYGRTFGTSATTPIIAAALNLLLQVDEELLPIGAKNILLETATSPDRYPEIHGKGLMNLLAAFERINK